MSDMMVLAFNDTEVRSITEETRKIWVREFSGKVEPDFSPEIKRELSQIWEGDMPMFHKYLDKYHSDCYKKQKGKPILF